MDDTRLAGLRVFLVEDETLVLMDAEMMLEELGCEIVATAMRLDQAQELVEAGLSCEIALLDVNLSRQMVLPLAEKLRGKGVPIVFASGYGQNEILSEWRETPMVQKPYSRDQLRDSLLSALG